MNTWPNVGAAVLELMSRPHWYLRPVSPEVQCSPRRPDWTGTPSGLELTPSAPWQWDSGSRFSCTGHHCMSLHPAFCLSKLDNPTLHPSHRLERSLCSGFASPADAPLWRPVWVLALTAGGWCSLTGVGDAPRFPLQQCLPCVKSWGEAPGAGSCSSAPSPAAPHHPADSSPASPAAHRRLPGSSSRVKSLPPAFSSGSGGRSQRWRALPAWPRRPPGRPAGWRGVMDGAPLLEGRVGQAPWPESVQLAKQGELPRQTAEV